MGVRMGEFAQPQWLDSFVFFNTMNGEFDKLHRKWLGAEMASLPTL
jgi:polar amino acid transport system substrate-binding protein